MWKPMAGSSRFFTASAVMMFQSSRVMISLRGSFAVMTAEPTEPRNMNRFTLGVAAALRMMFSVPSMAGTY